MFKRQIPEHAHHILRDIWILQFTMLTTNSVVDLNGKPQTVEDGAQTLLYALNHQSKTLLRIFWLSMFKCTYISPKNNTKQPKLIKFTYSVNIS